MIITLVTKVKKLKEEEIVLNSPEPNGEDAVWTWRQKMFRTEDIVDAELFNTTCSIVRVWDREAQEIRKVLVKETLESIAARLLMLSVEVRFTQDDDEDDLEDDSKEEENPPGNSSEEE